MQYEKRIVVCDRAGLSPRPLITHIISILFSLSIILFAGVSKKIVPVSYAAGREEFTLEEAPVVEEENPIVETVEVQVHAASSALKVDKVMPVEIDKVIEEEHALEKLYHYDQETYITVAKMISGEAGGVESETERSACVWIACNRSLDPRYPDSIIAVITKEGQFTGYSPYNNYTEADYNLAVDVLERFYREQHGATALEVGRTLPADYFYFHGDGEHNYFKKTLDGTPYDFENSELVSPYVN